MSANGSAGSEPGAVRIVLTGHVQAWQRAGGRGGQRFTPAHVRKYQDVLRLAAQQAFGRRALLTGAVHLTVRVFVPIPASMPAYQRVQAREGVRRPITRPDLGNYEKLVEDTLNLVWWADDAQVVEREGSGKWYSDRPRLEVEARELPAPPAFVRAPKPIRPREHLHAAVAQASLL